MSLASRRRTLLWSMFFLKAKLTFKQLRIIADLPEEAHCNFLRASSNEDLAKEGEQSIL